MSETEKDYNAGWDAGFQAGRETQWSSKKAAALRQQRQELYALVKEWRAMAGPGVVCDPDDCADDLERVLKGGE